MSHISEGWNFGQTDQTNYMKTWIVLEDSGQPQSEAAGFNLNYRCYVVEGSSFIEFSSSALIPPAPAVPTMRTAIVNAAIQAAAGQGKTVQAVDCIVIGGLM